MAICKFFANGYCRYGSNCRFQHISDTNDYYKKSYVRNDVRQTQTVSPPNRLNFSFNRTFEAVNNDQSYGQKRNIDSNSVNFGPKESQMSSFNRNVFQMSNSSGQPNQRTGTFSFNRALQQVTTGDRPPSRKLIMDDIDMDSSSVPRIRSNSGSQTNTFGLFSQTNQNLFGNRGSVQTKNDNLVNTNPMTANRSDARIKTNDDIYSKSLTEDELKQYQTNSFTFKSIPVSPPTKAICF